MHRDGVAPLPPQARLRAPVQQRNARPLRIGADEGGVALESGFAIGWRSSAHSTSFRATGSPIDVASAVASLGLRWRASSIACFVAARSAGGAATRIAGCPSVNRQGGYRYGLMRRAIPFALLRRCAPLRFRRRAVLDWAIRKGVPLVVGDIGDQNLVGQILREHEVQSIIHFAASAIVPDSVKDPLGYYKNNTVNSRALIETAVKNDLRQFIFSSTCAVYGNPAQVPVTEDTIVAPISPYGWSKLMTEIVLRDAGTAHGLGHVILRYFNVAGADPHCRTGQSSKNATHLIKVAVEAALGLRPKIDIYGADYPTPDGTCIRDYIHVSDLVRAHSDALRYLRAGGASLTLNCGYGHGFSVREVIEMVKRVSGVDFKVEIAPTSGDAGNNNWRIFELSPLLEKCGSSWMALVSL